MTNRQSRATATGLVAGTLWGLFLFLAFGLGHSFAPLGLSERILLGFLCLFLAAAHSGFFGLLASATAAVKPTKIGPLPVLGFLHLIAGSTYALLVLSVVKFSITRSHLSIADLRFFLSNLLQIVGEGTALERKTVALALLLPPLIALILNVASRVLAPQFRAVGVRELTVIGLAGVTGIAVVAWQQPAARGITTTLFPDSRLAARLLLSTSGGTTDFASWRSDPARQSRIAEREPPPAFRRWNVLVVMLESVSWSRAFGPQARPESTPNLIALAEESIAFDRAYATATHSDYAQTSILASLHPRKYRGHDYFVDIDYPRTLLWDLFSPLGYRTAIFSCQNESWGNMRAFLETPGLDLLRHAPDWPEAPRRGDAVSNQTFANPLDTAFRGAAKETKVFEETVVSSFLDWLDRTPEQPFAAYLNFQATHFPYVAPPGFEEVYQPAKIDFPATFFGYPVDKVPIMLNRWHNALAYVDRELGRLVDGLKTRETYDRTAILLVSDHGEAFYEGGFPTHGASLRDEQLRTVMMMRLPGLSPRRIAGPVSVLDALPTLTREMGLPSSGNWQGRDDLLDPDYSSADRPLLSTIQGLTREDSIVRGRFQYIYNWDRRESSLFDLSRPPENQVDLRVSNPLLRADLRGELLRTLGEQLSYYDDRGWEIGYFPPRIR